MKKVNLLTIFLLLILILFRDNILILFNNIYNCLFYKNNYENAEIMLLKDKVKYLENEYNELLDFKENLNFYATYNYIVSRVIYKENYFYNAKIIIEGGKNVGIKKGMAVINEDGLVGIVSNVLKNTSELTLLQNVDNLSVTINSSYGRLVYENGFKIKDISREENIKLNDEVYTSTLGNIKEKLYIGKVKNVEDKTIEKEILIDSNVDFNNLNYLLVIGDV